MNLSKIHIGLLFGTVVLMVAQMRDQILYFNDPVMGVAWIIAIASGWSVLPSLILYGNTMMRVMAIITTCGLFYWGDLSSVRASEAAKAERKLSHISHQKLGAIGVTLQNNMIRASNEGDTAGYEKALAALKEHLATDATAESAAALAITEEGGDEIAAAKSEAKMIAWSMEGMSIVLLVFGGLYGVVSGHVKMGLFGGEPAGKKSQGVAA